METALCNDATHGSVITVAIMGLDGITGVQTWRARCPVIHLSAQKHSVVSPHSTNAGLNYQLITQEEAISLLHSD